MPTCSGKSREPAGRKVIGNEVRRHDGPEAFSLEAPVRAVAFTLSEIRSHYRI